MKTTEQIKSWNNIDVTQFVTDWMEQNKPYGHSYDVSELAELAEAYHSEIDDPYQLLLYADALDSFKTKTVNDANNLYKALEDSKGSIMRDSSFDEGLTFAQRLIKEVFFTEAVNPPVKLPFAENVMKSK